MSKAKEEYNLFEVSIPEEFKEQYLLNKIEELKRQNRELEKQNEEMIVIIEKITGKSIEEVLKNDK